MATKLPGNYAAEKSDLENRAAFFQAELARIHARLAEVSALLGFAAAAPVAAAATAAMAAAPAKVKAKPGPKPAVAAAAAADAPRRRGRPPGSKNKAKDSVAAAPAAPAKVKGKPGRKPGSAAAKPAAKPAPVAAKPAPVAAKPAPVAAKPAPVAAKPAPVAAKPAPAVAERRGRRPASAASIHDKGIVDAAILLAKAKNITRADAGDVLAWFDEAGYKTRNGAPTRNSVYVSLNREFTEGAKKANPRITRVDRGAFEFHFDR